MNDVVYKCIALLFSILILVNGYVIKKWVGTWLFPACIFSLFWFGYTFFPLFFMYSVPVNPWAVIFIWGCCFIFSISSLCFNWKLAFRANTLKNNASEYFNSRFLSKTFFASSFLSLVFFYAMMRSQGFSIYDMFFNVFETAAKYIDMRYSETLEANEFGRLNLVFSYLAITIGGLLFGVERAKLKLAIILMAAFLPALASMLFQGNKGLLFLFVMLFFAGVLVVRVFENRLYIFDKATVKTVGLSLVVIVPAVVVSFLSRGLYDSEDSDYVQQRLIYYISSYAFTHIYAFSDWFSFAMGGLSINDYKDYDLSYGFQTFMAFFKMLGDTQEVPQGFFDEYYKFEDLLQSNIYTMFRGLIMDFGVLGTLLFMLISGWGLHFSFYHMLCKKKPAVSIVIFIFMIGYFYTTFIISIFVWNIIPLSIVLGSLVLLLNKYIIIDNLTNKYPVSNM
jgi:oligosaccharide repeat unit polymerase